MRALLRRPGFTAIAVITLALGIGANTAIFSVVQGVLLQPLPYPESDRLVALRQSNVTTTPAQPDAQIAPGNFLECQRQNTSFSSLAAYRTVSYNVTGDGNPERFWPDVFPLACSNCLARNRCGAVIFLPKKTSPDARRLSLLVRASGSDVSEAWETFSGSR
jgi:hypothetical protein